MKYGHKFTASTDYDVFAASDAFNIGPNVSYINENRTKTVHYHDLDKLHVIFYRTSNMKAYLPSAVSSSDVLLNDYSYFANFGKIVFKPSVSNNTMLTYATAYKNECLIEKDFLEWPEEGDQ